MVRRLAGFFLVGVLVLAPVACQNVAEQVGQVRDSAEDVVDRVRFCAAAIRVAGALEAGALAEAETQARDAAASAPEEVRSQLRRVLQGIEAARAGDGDALDDPEFQRAADHVASYTRDTCDPTS